MKIFMTAIGLCLALTKAGAQCGTVWKEQHFDSDPVTTIDLKGNEVYQYGIWIDGGSKAYIKDSYSYSGNQSYVLAERAPADKPNWSSIHTDILDFSGVSEVTIEFRYFVTNGFITNILYSNEKFHLQYSTTMGEVYTNAKTWNGSKDDNFWGNPYDWCEDFVPFPLNLACDLVTDQFKNDFWGTASVTIPAPSGGFTPTTTFKIQSDFSDSNTKLYIDNIKVMACGGSPAVNRLKPTNTYSSKGNKTLYNTEGFETDTGTGWGLWLDGGRDVYSTATYPATGDRSVAIKNYYDSVWLEYETDKFSGEKLYYSSIYTQNLDFTTVEELELNFSFVATGMDITPFDSLKNGRMEDTVDAFSLWVSNDAGISFSFVDRWTVGTDFVNEKRYEDVNVLVDQVPFTTTTILKLVAEGDDDSDRVYIDDMKITTFGSRASPAGTPKNLDWAAYPHSSLNADGAATDNAYELINQSLVAPENWDDLEVLPGNEPGDRPGQLGAVEHTECTSAADYGNHYSFGRHITEVYDDDLNKDVFAFIMHRDEDSDRCKPLVDYKENPITGEKSIDRQRLEIRTYAQSNEFQKGNLGETHFYSWKFKLPEGFKASDKFTHIHQIKPKGGTEDGMPMFTLTVGGPKADEVTGEETTAAEVRLRYSPDLSSQITIVAAPLAKFEGRWVQATEKIHYEERNKGRYELMIKDVKTGEVIMSFVTYSLRLWRTDAEHCRPKWGIYRSLLEKEKLRDETILFADFVILETDDKYGALEDFSNFSTISAGCAEAAALEVVTGNTVLEEETTLDCGLSGLKMIASGPYMLLRNLDRAPVLVAVHSDSTLSALQSADWVAYGGSIVHNGATYQVYSYMPEAVGELINTVPQGAFVLTKAFEYPAKGSCIQVPEDNEGLIGSLEDYYQERSDGSFKVRSKGGLSYAYNVKAPIPVQAGFGNKDGRFSEGIIEGFLGHSGADTDGGFSVTTGYSESGTPEAMETRQLKMDVYYPFLDAGVAAADAPALPVIVYVYGGAFIFNGWKNELTDKTCRYLASQGFIVAAIDYRLGMDVDEDPEVAKRAVYRATIDSRKAVTWWRENPTHSSGFWHADPTKVYMSGHSAGAITSLHNMFLDEDERRDGLPATYGGYPFKHRQETIDWWCLFRKLLPDVIDANSQEFLDYMDALEEMIEYLKSQSLIPSSVKSTLGTAQEITAWLDGSCHVLKIEMVDVETSALDDLEDYPKGRADAVAAISGAIGDTGWLSGGQPVMLVQHQDDWVVPAGDGKPFEAILDVAQKVEKVADAEIRGFIELEKRLLNPILVKAEQNPEVLETFLGALAIDLLKSLAEEVTLFLLDDFSALIQNIDLPTLHGSTSINEAIGGEYIKLSAYDEGGANDGFWSWAAWATGLPNHGLYHYPQTKKGVPYDEAAPELSIDDANAIMPNIRDFFRQQAYPGYDPTADGHTARQALEGAVEINGETSLKGFVYPNPTEGKVFLRLPTDMPTDIVVYSAYGHRVEAIHYGEGRAEGGYLVDLSAYESGMYILKVAQQGATYNHIVLKK